MHLTRWGGGALRTNESLSRSSDSKQLEDITQENQVRNDIPIIPNHLKENGQHSAGCRKVAFTLAKVFLPHSAGRRKVAFTLAEVLITLGIIGVVAALTIPTLISNYRKNVVETRLAKFYTVMNQAVQSAEAEYGDKMGWDPYEKLYETDEDGKQDTSKPIPNIEYFNKYFAPYLITTKVETFDQSSLVKVSFPDGSVATFSSASIKFFPIGKDFLLIESTTSTGGFKNNPQYSGIKYFTFLFAPTQSSTLHNYHYGKGIEPYKYRWDGTEEMLLTDSSIGCKETVTNERAYCTALIQLNGWKIPKNYPLRF